MMFYYDWIRRESDAADSYRSIDYFLIIVFLRVRVLFLFLILLNIFINAKLITEEHSLQIMHKHARHCSYGW